MSEKPKTVKKKKKWGKVYEYTPIARTGILDGDLAKEIEKEVKKGSFQTPSQLATKYGIKVSLAKKILREFEEKKVLTAVYDRQDNRIYTK